MDKRTRLCFFLLLCSIAICVWSIAYVVKETTIWKTTYPDIEVYFSPEGGCTEAIVRAIERVEKSIYVQAYSFTSKPIADALMAAKKRGCDVEMVVDKSQKQEPSSKVSICAQAGINVFWDEAHAIAHNKIMILDEKEVITGSFNFTNAAEKNNAENLLYMTGDRALVKQYLENYFAHRAHSKPYAQN